MAGAKPEYFPVILALASTEVTATHSSTSSFAAMVVVNGPIRREIGMNSGSAHWDPSTMPMPPLDGPMDCFPGTWVEELFRR